MSTSARGFSVAHQRVCVDVDIRKRVFKGWTEITIVPTRLDLKTIILDARRMCIEKCYVNGLESKFNHFDLLSSPPNHPPSWEPSQYSLYEQKLAPLMQPVGPGELTIQIPESVEIKEPDANTFIASHSTKEKTYEPLTVRVDYHLLDGPNEGLNMVDSQGSEPHMYTTHSPIGQATSCWLPCVDGLWSLSTWQLEFCVPQLLDPLDQESEILIACTDVNPSETPDPNDHNKKIVKFEVFSPVSSHHVGFAIGPFKPVTLSSVSEDKDQNSRSRNINDYRENSRNNDDSQGLVIVAYALPSKVSQVSYSCGNVLKAMHFFLLNYGSFPYTSYTLCFVGDSYYQTADACALTICSDKLLFTRDVIEPLFTNADILVRAIAAQWSGVSIVPQRWSDLWITEGIAQYMANLFIKRLMGNNEYRFRIRMQNEKLCEEDIGQPPIGKPALRFPLCQDDLSFLRLKAPLVLYILDRRMTKTDRSLGMARVLTKLFLQSMSGDLRSQLSTSHFIRQCEKVAHHRLNTFFDEWVFKSGYPIFRVTQRFNKKRNFIEMGIAQVHSRELPDVVLKDETYLERAVTQLHTANANGGGYGEAPNASQQPSLNFTEGNNSSNVEFNQEFLPSQVFAGPMTIRIHEADGTPYEHVVDLKDQFTKLDIQYNTKYKRLKRNQKFRKNTPGNAPEDKLINCLGDILMSDHEVAQWQLVDWGDAEEDEGMFNEAFEWMRVDADFQWLGRFFVGQPDYMYASQLQQDRDVVAHYDAVKYYSRQQPNPIYASILTRTLMDNRYFYGVRIAAAESLAALAVPQLRYAGKRLLLKVFQELYCFNKSRLPKANDFSNFADYFVQKAIPNALSTIRDKATNQCPFDICVFLLDLIRYNENSENVYSDSFYLASLIESVTNTLRLVDPNTNKFIVYGLADYDIWDNQHQKQFIADVVSEIHKLQRLDKWLPSRHHIVTTTSLRMGNLLISAGYGEPRMDKLLLTTKPEEPNEVRITATDLLLELGGHKNAAVMNYLTNTMLEDSSLTIKLGLLHSFVKLVGHTAINGEFPSEGTSAMSLRQHALAIKSVSNSLAMLRKGLGTQKSFTTALWNALLDSRSGSFTRRRIIEVLSVLLESEPKLIAKMKAPKLFEVSMKRKKGDSYIMVAKYRSVLRKKRKQEPEIEKPKLRLKLGSGR